MKAKFCVYCGSPLDEASGKCTFCGFFNGDGSQDTSQSQTGYQQQTPPPQLQYQQQQVQPQYQQQQVQPQYQQQQVQPQYQQSPYVNPDYVDQEIIMGDPRFSQGVDPSVQWAPRQVPGTYVTYNTYNTYNTPAWPLKSKAAAGLLGIFLGAFGVHKLYLGKSSGWAYMLVTLLSCGILSAFPAIIGLIEGIIYLTMSDDEFEAKNQVRTK